MKGIIFNAFNNLVEDAFGLQMWQDMLDTTNPPSGGVYTAAGTYDDSEIVGLLSALSKLSNTPTEQLLLTFGAYLFGKLAQAYPAVLPDDDSLFGLLKGLDGIIHVEVKKLYPQAQLPTFTYTQPNDSTLVMDYISQRRLTPLAKGLMMGASKHFNTPVEIDWEAVSDTTDRFTIKRIT